jgi:hypothetical protein
LNRAFACLALAGFVSLPGLLGAQDSIPDSLRGSALAIRVHAVIPLPTPASAAQGAQTAPPQEATPGAQAKPPVAPSTPEGADQAGKGSGAGAPAGKAVAWQNQSVKYTLPGRPVPFKFIGSNVVIVVQITPFAQEDDKGLTLVAHGQVWVQGSGGGLSYRTAIDTLSVDYGETVLFYPLGLDASGNAPLRLEITVLRAADQDVQADKQPPSKAGADKSAPEKPSPDKAAPDKPSK